MHRTWDGIAAGTLFMLPSLFILIERSWIYLRSGDVPVVAGLFYGLKPAVTALALHASHRLGHRALRKGWLWGLAAASFPALAVLDTPFPALGLTAGLIGWLGARRRPQVFAPGGGHYPTVGRAASAVIDDHTPPPAHPRFTCTGLLRVVGAGLALWLATMAVLVLTMGLHGTLTQMGWFLTKAALSPFGGAYAVLPYGVQGAVETHQWLSRPLMIDGLALGETTSGPLIMVVAVVAFLGGWKHEVLCPNALFLGGALAAAVVTWFTSLPSFLFTLAGGPLVEATHGRLAFTASLTAITAAVVGVIAALSLFFARHLLWPLGLDDPIDAAAAAAAALGLAASVALFRFKMGVIPLLSACAVAGLGIRWWMGFVYLGPSAAELRHVEQPVISAGREMA